MTQARIASAFPVAGFILDSSTDKVRPAIAKESHARKSPVNCVFTQTVVTPTPKVIFTTAAAYWRDSQDYSALFTHVKRVYLAQRRPDGRSGKEHRGIPSKRRDGRFSRQSTPWEIVRKIRSKFPDRRSHRLSIEHCDVGQGEVRRSGGGA
ncbi:hypothetical protein KM043_010104 [Ampulex compressa]|nr:hypothetical protein KM043_010104 [Ampulex compressa]